MWTSFKLYQISIYSSEQRTLSEHLLLLLLSLLPNYQTHFKKFPPPLIHIFPILPRFDRYPDSLIGVIHLSIVRFINVFQKESSTTKPPSLGNKYSDDKSHLTKNGNVIFVRCIYLRIDCTPDHELKSLPSDTFLFLICN